MPSQTDQTETVTNLEQCEDDKQKETEILAALEALQCGDEWERMPRDPNDTNPAWCLYRYRGTMMSSIAMLAGCRDFWTQFRGRPSDIIVASFPKSGTTWLQELVWRVVHQETGPESGGGDTIEHRFPLIDLPATPEFDLAPLEGLAEPRLLKTHMPYHLLPEGVTSSGTKVLYVSRDPRDVCVSFYHFSRLMAYQKYRGTFAEFRDRFTNDLVVYGPYREHVKGYLEHSDTVLCLTYEQMHQDRASVVRKVAEFLDVALSEEQVEGIVSNTSFGVMKENPGTNFQQWNKTGFITEGRFMRKGVVGDWKNYFTEEESDKFMKWYDQPVHTRNAYTN